MENVKSHSKEMQKELNILQSRLDALEVSSTDRYDKSVIGTIKVLVENQKHLIEEFDHLKKAIDLVTLEIFKIGKSHSH